MKIALTRRERCIVCGLGHFGFKKTRTTVFSGPCMRDTPIIIHGTVQMTRPVVCSRVGTTVNQSCLACSAPLFPVSRDESAGQSNIDYSLVSTSPNNWLWTTSAPFQSHRLVHTGGKKASTRSIHLSQVLSSTYIKI